MIIFFRRRRWTARALHIGSVCLWGKREMHPAGEDQEYHSRKFSQSTPTTIIKQFSKKKFTSHSSISNGMQGLFIQSNVSQSPSFLWWEPIKASHTQEQNEKFQFHTTFCKKNMKTPNFGHSWHTVCIYKDYAEKMGK